MTTKTMSMKTEVSKQFGIRILFKQLKTNTSISIHIWMIIGVFLKPNIIRICIRWGLFPNTICILPKKKNKKKNKKCRPKVNNNVVHKCKIEMGQMKTMTTKTTARV